MKKVTLTVLMLLTVATQAFARTEGSMTCKVTGTQAIATEEGVFKQYIGRQNSVRKNDRLEFKYRSTAESIYLQLVDSSGKTIINVLSDSETSRKSNRPDNRGIIGNSPLGDLSFLPDYIIMYQFNEKLFMRRYYKNDWEGLYTNLSSRDMGIEVVTLNCRHDIDKMEEVFQEFKIKSVESK